MCFSKYFFSIDIDECIEGTDTCDQVCSNTLGSYNCSCLQGYLLLDDGISCEG